MVFWNDTTEHKKDAEWLKDMKSEANTRKQENLKIDIGKLRAVLKKMSNWKAPGPDLVQGFWLKNMTNMHARLVDQLNVCLTPGEVPQCMTKGRTLLFVKDPTLGNGASNYRPITCLPLKYKLLTRG